jgi:hypothetical protein
MSALEDLSRPWGLCLVRRTHVDIVCTEPRTGMLTRNPRFTAQALDYCRAADYPPSGAQGRSICKALGR